MLWMAARIKLWTYWRLWWGTRSSVPCVWITVPIRTLILNAFIGSVVIVLKKASGNVIMNGPAAEFVFLQSELCGKISNLITLQVFLSSFALHCELFAVCCLLFAVISSSLDKSFYQFRFNLWLVWLILGTAATRRWECADGYCYTESYSGRLSVSSLSRASYRYSCSSWMFSSLMR